MNICFLKDDVIGGGVDRVVTTVANKIANDYSNISVFFLDLYNEERTNYYDISSKIKYDILGKKISSKKEILIRNYNLFKYLKKNEIDILITSQPMLGLYSMIPAKLTGIRHIIWEHGNYYQKQGTKYIDLIRQIELLICDDYIVLTDSDKKVFQKNFIIKSSLKRMYNPISQSSKKKYNYKNKVIMSAGHLRYIKGFDLLIEVANIVLKKYPDWVWNIYGEGPDKKKLQEKIKFYNLENNVFLRGRTDKILEEMSNSSIFVLTSRMEGLPMVLLEAKSMKQPLISFNIESGPEEIIDNNINGFLIEPFKIKQMAQKIILLIENENLRVKFSNNSRIGLSKFNLDSIVAEWIRTFNE